MKRRLITCCLLTVAALLWVRIWFHAQIAAAEGRGAAAVRQEWSAANDRAAAVNAQRAAEAERQRRDEEHAKQDQAERIARDTDQREADQRSRAVRAEQRNRSLLDTIASLNARNAELSRTSEDATARALAHEASAARELLGQCSSRYTAVAAAADGFRSQVIGLQDYVATVCVAPASKDQ